MSENQEIFTNSEAGLSLGALAVSGPSEVVQRASVIATALAQVINDRKLYTVIRRRKYVRVEGWNTLGAMLGVVPREMAGLTIRHEGGSWEAWVELVRVSDGAIIGRGSAVCSPEERNWRDRDEFARRSMAVTRATGKAFRLGFAWIMTLAGYEPTPFEEMPPELIEDPNGTVAKPDLLAINGTNPKVRALVEAGLAPSVRDAAEILSLLTQNYGTIAEEDTAVRLGKLYDDYVRQERTPEEAAAGAVADFRSPPDGAQAAR